MELNEDGNAATLNVTGPYNAQQLDDLLRKLALLRAKMTPAVPATIDDLEQTDARVLVEDKPALVIAARQDGGFRLWLRHRGFGWLAYQVENRTAIGLRDYISQRSTDEPINLITHEDSNRH